MDAIPPRKGHIAVSTVGVDSHDHSIVRKDGSVARYIPDEASLLEVSSASPAVSMLFEDLPSEENRYVDGKLSVGYSGCVVHQVQYKFLKISPENYSNEEAVLVSFFDEKLKMCDDRLEDEIGNKFRNRLKDSDRKRIKASKEKRCACLIVTHKYSTRCSGLFHCLFLDAVRLEDAAEAILNKMVSMDKTILVFSVVANKMLGVEAAVFMKVMHQVIEGKDKKSKPHAIIFCVDTDDFHIQFDHWKDEMVSSLKRCKTIKEEETQKRKPVAQVEDIALPVPTTICTSASEPVRIEQAEEELFISATYVVDGGQQASVESENLLRDSIVVVPKYEPVEIPSASLKPQSLSESALAQSAEYLTSSEAVGLAVLKPKSDRVIPPSEEPVTSLFKTMEYQFHKNMEVRLEEAGLEKDNSIKYTRGRAVFQIIASQITGYHSDSLIVSLKEEWRRRKDTLSNIYVTEYKVIERYMDNIDKVVKADSNTSCSVNLLQFFSDTLNVSFEFYSPSDSFVKSGVEATGPQRFEPSIAGLQPERVRLMDDGFGQWYGLKPRRKDVVSPPQHTRQAYEESLFEYSMMECDPVGAVLEQGMPTIFYPPNIDEGMQQWLSGDSQNQPDAQTYHVGDVKASDSRDVQSFDLSALMETVCDPPAHYDVPEPDEETGSILLEDKILNPVSVDSQKEYSEQKKRKKKRKKATKPPSMSVDQDVTGHKLAGSVQSLVKMEKKPALSPACKDDGRISIKSSEKKLVRIKQKSRKLTLALSEIKAEMNLKPVMKLRGQVLGLASLLKEEGEDSLSLFNFNDVDLVVHAYKRLASSHYEGRLRLESKTDLVDYVKLVWQVFEKYFDKVEGSKLDQYLNLIKIMIESCKKIDLLKFCRVQVLRKLLPHLNRFPLKIITDLAPCIARMDLSYVSDKPSTVMAVTCASGVVEEGQGVDIATDESSADVNERGVEREVLQAFFNHLKSQAVMKPLAVSVKDITDCCDALMKAQCFATNRKAFTQEECNQVCRELCGLKSELVRHQNKKVDTLIEEETKRLEEERKKIEEKKQKQKVKLLKVMGSAERRIRENERGMQDVSTIAKAATQAQVAIERPDKIYYEAFRRFHNNEIKEALAMYEQLIDRFPCSPYCLLAKMAAIESRMSLPSYQDDCQAIKALETQSLEVCSDYQRAVEANTHLDTSADKLESLINNIHKLVEKVEGVLKDTLTEQQMIIDTLTAMLLSVDIDDVLQLPEASLQFHIEQIVAEQEKISNVNDSLMLAHDMARKAIEKREVWLAKIKKKPRMRRRSGHEWYGSRQQRPRQKLSVDSKDLIARLEASQRRLSIIKQQHHVANDFVNGLVNASSIRLQRPMSK